MEKNKKLLLRERKFLNTIDNPTYMGAIASEVKFSRPWNYRKELKKANLFTSADTTLDISDCSQTIHIDTSFYGDKKDFKNSINKLNIIIDVVTRHRDALLKAKEVTDKGDALVKKLNKKKKKEDKAKKKAEKKTKVKNKEEVKETTEEVKE